jgi:D-alanyl-D-alanine carboxypeptidase (penicillin-binding protein 5/6)
MKRTDIKKYIYSAAVFAAVFASALFPCRSSADDIDARAAVVIDGQSGKILFAKNPNVKLQPASTTKLITAMVTIDNLNPETVVTVSKNAANTPSVSPRLRPGEKLTVRDLLSLALVRSVNSAAVALAEAVSGSETRFVHLMNEKAAAIGADNTRFINASGLPGPGQHITAFDLALIMKEALRYPLIKETINTRTAKVVTEEGRSLSLRNTNHMLWNDEDALGGKTGFTRAAGHCLVFASQKGNTLLVASLLGESVRSKVWDNSATLLAFGEEVLKGNRQPQVYYTINSDSHTLVAEKRSKSVEKRGRYKRLVSKKKVIRERNRPVQVSKKEAGRKDAARVSKKDSKKSRVEEIAKSKRNNKNKTVAANKNKKTVAANGKNKNKKKTVTANKGKGKRSRVS